MLVENMLRAAESAFPDWNIIRGNTLIHAIMKTQETTGTIETLSSKTSENTPIFKESEKESGSVSRLIVAGGAHLIQGELLLPQYPPLHQNGLPETQSDVFTASHLRGVAV